MMDKKQCPFAGTAFYLCSTRNLMNMHIVRLFGKTILRILKAIFVRKKECCK